MADLVTPSGLSALTTISKDAELEFHESGSLINNKITVGNFSKDVGRYQVATSGIIETTGWHRVVQTDVGAGNADNVLVKITASDGLSKTCIVSVRPTTVGVTTTNAKIETIADCFQAGLFNAQIRNVRVVKSASSADLGFSVEAYLTSGLTYIVEVFNSTPRLSTLSGLYPIVASSTYAGKLPDDSTVGTYLMAGEEKSITGLSSLKTTCPGFMAYKASNDVLRCSVTWDVLPAYGTTVTLTASALEFISINGNTSAALASYTTSGLSIKGYNVSFSLNQTGIATGITNGYPCFAIPTGSLTIMIA